MNLAAVSREPFDDDAFAVIGEVVLATWQRISTVRSSPMGYRSHILNSGDINSDGATGGAQGGTVDAIRGVPGGPARPLAVAK
ncbi:MAG: hypothetical protein FIB00_12005 [Chloroflexi bacterium]|nr:hypothetical protein [Dehalococcoidia bacterium]NJD65945.1 hypothetical protein [Chloroflexota bacterium]PWB44992.1 MAG: hypothetical protein C3F10_07215 [Dehalococcoidia bacterium]